MLLSLDWMNDFIECDATAAELADALTMAGIEVEEIITIGSQWDGIVVGDVTAISPHPNADKLSCASVHAGDQTYSVVCGAPNIAPGQKVPLALPGAVLPGGHGIKKTKIRGVASDGMICSETELGLGVDTSGIMVLDNALASGMPLSDALALHDTVLSLGITPNRSDCFSILGLAREVAAIYDLQIRYPETRVVETGPSIDECIDVHIIDADLCPRYAARFIDSVAIAPSPLWMRRRLENCGIRSINNIVDITNYVLLEWGQPLHAFDYSRLDGRKIIVRRALSGETFVTLDEVERRPDSEVVMICDDGHPVAIGGIMGGRDSGIEPGTHSVLLESAFFTPSSIARSSGCLKLKTEASERFKKGVDINGIIPALNRAAHLISHVAGGRVARGAADVYPQHLPARDTIRLSVSKVCSTIGMPVARDTIRTILERLSMFVSDCSDDALDVTAPSFRYDIAEPVDLIEEVARISGYSSIPATYPQAPVVSAPVNSFQRSASQARDVLIACGLQEVINYSFYDPALLQALHMPDTDPRTTPVMIRNPLSTALSALRTMILPSLLVNLRTNVNNKADSIKIFEISTVFSASADRSTLQAVETKHLTGLIAGLRYPLAWNRSRSPVDFFDMKGIVEDVLEKLRIVPFRFVADGREPYLHPKNMLSIYIHGTFAGVMGEIHPDVMENFDVSGPACMFDLDFDLLSHYYGTYPEFQPFSRHPAVYRDMALMVDADVPAGRLDGVIEKCRHPLIQEYVLFDTYQGDTIPAGKKSIAYRFKYQATDRTLTDNEVNKIHDAVLSHLTQSVGAELR
jgi:phenylalanyl-tRNA synthetase beta chain